MARVLESQLELKEARELSFEDRLGMMLEAESLERENRETTARLRSAKLRLVACLEDLKFKPGRGLERALLTTLSACDWVRDKRNIRITGATGTGKTYIACALGRACCRHGFSTAYYRASALFDDLILAKSDGRYKRILSSIESKRLFILDDFGLEKLTAENRMDLLEIMERRYGISSTIIASQLPVEHWHEVIGDPTIADAILDRTVHNSYHIKLKGPTMRDEGLDQNG
jgi:DNA replication protein DnaC